MKKIKISSTRSIGRNEPCFIIAEVGSNHNRSMVMAKDLILAAANAGADAVKFQLFEGDKHYSRKTPRFKLYKKHIVDLLNEISLPRDWIFELNEFAVKNKIIFFSSVTHKDDVDLLRSMNAGVYKLASFELVDLELIKYVALTGKPIILSTGMADMKEIGQAYRACLSAGNNKIIFLECASAYPAPYNAVNLNAMSTIGKKFNVITGFSDHTVGSHISAGAVAMGARVIEKHFTLSRELKGPDHPFAIEPGELKLMVKHIREIESALGDGAKNGPSKSEMEYYKKARRSVHAAISISRGEIIRKDMLAVKRPGYGIKPSEIKTIIGKKAIRSIRRDEWITRKMLS